MQQQLYDLLRARPGLFTQQETSVLNYLLHRQFTEHGTVKPKRGVKAPSVRDEMAALWGVVPQDIRQQIVSLEGKRAVARLSRGSQQQDTRSR